VISNLLNNAAKYTERGGTIELSAGRENDFMTVSVRDSGIGIAADVLPRVFDMFMQVDSGGISAHGGLGLGLTLAKHLVELHGGTIEGRSDGRGKGSEFIVRLPVVAGDGAETAPVPRSEPDAAPSDSSKRILVVDDREAQAQSLAMLLESMGHQVRIAHDGPRALEIAREFLPEVGLIDIGLPGMTGYEVARRLRDQPQLANMLLIAQTGWGRDEDRERAREAGFDHHMAKPIDHQSLFRLISGLQKDP
jgi:CheY-like chemotaxis protein